MSTIDRVELHEFTFDVEDLAAVERGRPSFNLVYLPGARTTFLRYAVVIRTSDGSRGEYVPHWIGGRAELAQSIMLAPMLIGRDALGREQIFDDFKRGLRKYDHMGHGPIDIALWDLAGKRLGCSIQTLLGGYRKRLLAYASTYHADRNGGLDSKEAFAGFAERCYQQGYRAFKIHGWGDGDAREEAANVRHVAERVGDRMTLMIDPACELRTFADALYVGRACDDAGFFWYEDPFRDAGTSAFAANKLRSMLKTPLLMMEHIRGVEPKADFILAGGTDFVRADPEYDMGITGCMKIAHLAEALGLDCEVHASGPAHRHCMAAMRNTNFYEVALVHPRVRNAIAPVYACDYSDQLDAVGEDGCVPVPDGPGLGVVYDWDWIDAHRTALHVFE